MRAIVYDRAKKGFLMEGSEPSMMTNSEILAVSKILLESRAFTRRELNVILGKYYFYLNAFIVERDDALQVRTNTVLQDMFSSKQRATLISVESFTFSVIMVVLSPLAGALFSRW